MSNSARFARKIFPSGPTQCRPIVAFSKNSANSSSLRRSSSSAALRSMNWPTLAATELIISKRSTSGSRLLRVRNSMTASVRSPTITGHANALCNPCWVALASRGKFLSCDTFDIHAGLPLLHTRPGSPSPLAKLRLQLAVVNSVTGKSALCQ